MTRGSLFVTEEGSASLLVMVALSFATILVAFSSDLSRASAARARAQAAADAAALAAAQELLVPTERMPAEVAADYAVRNGARLVEVDLPSGGEDVIVSVELDVTLPFLGQTRTVLASARAVVAAPPGAEGLRPFFISRLVCLFDRVEGLWIVSGFRTRAEQAALHEAKPGLAAPPGHSNHEIGLAADLGFPTDFAEREAHAASPVCGLEFPVSYEPWHVEPAGL
jgi:secretion/DNA translocation related TadE-like protein